MNKYRKEIITLLLTVLGVSSAWSEGTPSWPLVSREAKAGTRWWWMGSAVDEGNLSWNLSHIFSHNDTGNFDQISIIFSLNSTKFLILLFSFLQAYLLLFRLYKRILSIIKDRL